MRKIRLNRCVVLPKYIADKFVGLDLKSSDRDKALKFLRILSKKSKQDNDGDMFRPVEISSHYLRKVFGWRYNDFLSKLLEANIIYSDGKYSVNKKKCKKYSLVFKDYVSDSELDNLLSNYDGETRVDVLLDDRNIVEVFNYFEKVPVEKYAAGMEFYNSCEDLHICEQTLSKCLIDHINNVSIDNYETDYDIKLPSVPVVYYNKGVIWRQTKKVIEEANKCGKSLIRDKNKYYVMNKEDFIKRKKKTMLISHSDSLMRLFNKDYYYTRNDTNNRVDTNITSLPSYLYNVILKDNDMVELDLSCSQMALIQLICDLDTDDYSKFFELSSTGGLYSYISNELGLNDRSKGKNICFSVLFSKCGYNDPNVKMFRSLFPSLMEWIDNFKKENESNMFAVSLQKKEAELFIDNISIPLYKKKIKHFTKHDSISVNRKYKDKVLKAMEKCFEKYNFKCKINEK